jgi:hypothetical protein
LICRFVDRRHYEVGGGLMDHMADPRDAAQHALSYGVVKSGRLLVDVDQPIFLAGDDGNGHF